MTILNTASDGFFNVLIALHRTVARDGPLERDDLLGRCKPGPDADDQRLRQTLLRWTQLGLFQGQDNKIALAPEDRDPGRLPARCRLAAGNYCSARTTTRTFGIRRVPVRRTSPVRWPLC
jgi:hypothetical protein